MNPPRQHDLSDYIRAIPDFPIPGILFRDITPLLASPAALRQCVDLLAEVVAGTRPDVIAAVDARGFLFAPPLALRMELPLVPVRKKGKLPYETISHTYDLEYGTDTLEIHTDAIQPGNRVLVVDDLLATGGTVEACCRLIEKAGGEVAGCAFVIELLGLAGARRIADYPVFRLVQYE